MTGHKLGEPVSQDEMNDCYQGGPRMTTPESARDFIDTFISEAMEDGLVNLPNAQSLIEVRDAAIRKAAFEECEKIALRIGSDLGESAVGNAIAVEIRWCCAEAKP